MQTVEIDDDVCRYLLSRAERFGETPNDILRREFNLKSRSTPRTASNGILLDGMDQRLLTAMRNGSIQGRTATATYLHVLAFALKENVGKEVELLTFPAGRKRIYFARSRQEIENHGKSTHPQKISGTAIWALTNSTTPEKRDTLIRALRILGYSTAVARDVADTLF